MPIISPTGSFDIASSLAAALIESKTKTETGPITYPNSINASAVRNTSKYIIADSNMEDVNQQTLADLVSVSGNEAGVQAVYVPKRLERSDNFPISTGPLYTAIDPREIYPWMHTMGAAQNSILEAHYNGGMGYMYPTYRHITSTSTFDPIPNAMYSFEQYVPGANGYGKWNLKYRQANVYQFRGSVTEVNPEKDPEKQYVLDNGLENADKRIVAQKTGESENATTENMAAPRTPTSPIHTFTRSYADRSRAAIVTSYNRTRLPIADIEHRKAFRYIFITRPECYILTSRDQLSLQAENDEDMNALWYRMPHVLRALSPVYIARSPVFPEYANWNYLLCNRVMGMSAAGHTLTTLDSVTKSVRGATVMPGKIMTSNLGNNLELSFRDTKYMDVYEMLRGWMLYIHKRRTGQFFPPFNGYDYNNLIFKSGAVRNDSHLHPYDRALEYCASIYDIITNETGTKILYWCKYYGVYPTTVNTSMLSNDNAAAITQEAKVNASFIYQYKQENVFRNLVEFNFNAGIFDCMGVMRSDFTSLLSHNAVPFLYRENYIGGDPNSTSDVLKNYIGAADMITGSPFIVSEYNFAHDPWSYDNGESKVVQSNLCFVPSYDETSMRMNLGITNRAETKMTRDIFAANT